ncbi:MAG: LLM class flavin-dependent oxidoreductase [Anaerolineae bacterium]|nr:LLM class flavin-dependent oxidoreductase [Anaerolineae bacterium]
MSLPKAGLVITPSTARATLDTIVQADRRGVPMLWSITLATLPDPMTLLAAAAVQTGQIGLGTAIVQTYPRNPVVLAMQAAAIDGLAPGRFRLGIGPGSPRPMEGIYGATYGKPLPHLREYVAALRGLLWEGAAHVEGLTVRVHAELPNGVQPPRVPIILSALRPLSFRLAGELADGAVSWIAPVPYLLKAALPAMRGGAAKADRPTPRLIAHVPVALSEDRAQVHSASRARFGFYARLPFYIAMFAEAGFPVPGDGTLPDALLDELIVRGLPVQVEARLRAILDGGIDEVMVTVVPVVDEAAENAATARILAAIG